MVNEAGATLPVYGSYDVLVDLSALPWNAEQVASHLQRLARYAGFGAAGARICVALPAGLSGLGEGVPDAGPPVLAGTGAAAVRIALRRAAAGERALLVILGALLPPNECVPVLWAALAQDPLLGSAQPRFAHEGSDAVLALPGAGTALTLARAALPRLPRTVITAEMLAACTLVRTGVVESLADDDGQAFESTAGAFLAALVAARRRGFRNVVANRAVVAAPGPEAAYPALPPQDAARLDALRPDHRKAVAANQALAVRALEAAIAGMQAADGRLRVLLDCRGLSPVHNGTSQCVLGLLDGLAAAAPPWEIHVASQAPALRFHRLAQRYPDFLHEQGPPSGSFAAALVPNQPWSLATIAELHRHAWAVAFNMLDTIAWDILYPADERVEPAWRFLAEYADGIAYNSGYTQERVRLRFPVAPGRVERVVHHSLDAGDHSLPALRGQAEASHVLLFGNTYDHKDLGPTLAVLTDAFPEQPFVVLGGAGSARANVTTVPSGEASAEQVHALIASARCVVYPSFYEGFGLPLVESLSYGRTVLARSSPLWHEIVSHARLPGRVATYHTQLGLVELLGRHLAGLPLTCLPAGGALAEGEAAVDWTGSARRMIEFIHACIDAADASSWLRRECALRNAGL
ncbi:glycosyltransferase [Xenophilus sp.]|uniref:glycosyltransferase n=1 Tax=Xenophilus sp. TaxID=1873499 RepID=UPI0037DCC7F1